MDMHWLDDVLVLLEERNMSRAAKRRNITQPAFSRRIRSFETWLGVEILERSANRIAISPALANNEDDIRALVDRIQELRTKIVHHGATAAVVAIAAQHAPMFSTFPDMALRARSTFPRVSFRLRAGNLSDCMAMFLRGDANMLLCYEAYGADPMHFGAGVKRSLWGQDYLVPLVGGSLRYSVRDNRVVPLDTPAIVYPENSYFGSVLRRHDRVFGTPALSRNPVCESAFSNGIREMVLAGLGVGWLPFSMVHREIESGELVSLSNQFGKEPMDVAIYANTNNQLAEDLLDFWAAKPGP